MTFDPFLRHWRIQPTGSPWIESLPQVFPISPRFRIEAGPHLRITKAEVAAGTVYILGVFGDARLLDEPSIALPKVLASTSGTAFVDAIRHLAGNCVVVRPVADGNFELFTDAGGMMQVYRRGDRLASCIDLLDSSSNTVSAIQNIRLTEQDPWRPLYYPLVSGIEVIPANHVYRSENQATTRFWPDFTTLSTRGSHDVAPIVADMARYCIQSLPDDVSLKVSVTGGRDSRLVLAAAYAAGRTFEPFTIKAKSTAHADLRLATTLCKTIGVSHVVVHDHPASAEIVSAYRVSGSHLSVGARAGILGACSQLASPSAVHLSGTLGEATRIFYSGIPADGSPVSVDHLSTAFPKRDAQIRDALDRWLKSASAVPNQLLGRLFYLEQRGGRWAGVGDAASSVFYAPFTIFNCRALLEAAWSLNDRSDTLLKLATARLVPSFSTIPYASRFQWVKTMLPTFISVRLRQLKAKIRR